jgi:hypothetical protein
MPDPPVDLLVHPVGIAPLRDPPSRFEDVLVADSFGREGESCGNYLMESSDGVRATRQICSYPSGGNAQRAIASLGSRFRLIKQPTTCGALVDVARERRVFRQAEGFSVAWRVDRVVYTIFAKSLDDVLLLEWQQCAVFPS